MYSMRTMKLIFALGLVGLAPYAFAASFDCTKAGSPTEKLICSDAQTSALDSKLQQAYKTALKATDAYGNKALAKEQRNWIQYTRASCQDVGCLQQVYSARIAMLARNEKDIINGKPYCAMPSGGAGEHGCGVYVVPYRDPNDRIDSFNESLVHQRKSSKIIGCSRLIDLPLGRAYANHSFGGICILQDGLQRKDVEICNDNKLGAFKLQPANSKDVSEKSLIDFVYNNCTD
jgi:uncharacterized protein